MPDHIDELIFRSSLGARVARRIAATTPPSAANEALVRAGVIPRGRDFSHGGGHTSPVSSTTRAPNPGTSPGSRTPMAGKTTSAKAAKAASKVLRDGRTSKASKTAAGSALSQRPKKGK